MAITNQLLPVNVQIYTTNLGSTLFLKTCGFVEDHQARIVEVAENYLKVRIGNTWFERLFYRCENSKPVEVTLRIHPPVPGVLSERQQMQMPAIGCAQIDVTIVPRSIRWKEHDFQQWSRRMIWSLRRHFISP